MATSLRAIWRLLLARLAGDTPPSSAKSGAMSSTGTRKRAKKRSSLSRPSQKQLEKRLGYRFSDPRLLELALTHRSLGEGSSSNFERLEYLGDAILTFIISDYLYGKSPGDSEGDLTLRRSALVNKNHLADVGGELGLHRYIRAGGGVNLSDAKVRRNLMGDAYEATVGALYLDGGLDAAQRFVRRTVVRQGKDDGKDENYKGRLIEFCHQSNLAAPRFKLVATEGPEHDKSFLVRVQIGSRSFEPASADNKKAAQQAAAGNALSVLNQEFD